MAATQMRDVLQQLRRTVLLQDSANLTDAQLLHGFTTRRDEAAVAALVRRHGPMVWNVCRRILRDYYDAEDAFQATFLVLVRKAASIASRELLANWLYGVAYQTAWKARATTAKRRAREKQVEVMPEREIVQRDLWRDVRPVLDQELSRLPQKYRISIILCDLEGKTRREAARQLGVPEGTVAGRLARARTMLAKRLARLGWSKSGGALAAMLAQNAASASVPASVACSTIKAATLFAAGQAAAGAISANAGALAEGVLKTMLLTKLKIATAALALVAVLGAGAAALTQQTRADRPPQQASRERAQQVSRERERPAEIAAPTKPADPPAPDKKVQAEAPAKEKKDPENHPAQSKNDSVWHWGVVVGAVDAGRSTITLADNDFNRQRDLAGKTFTVAPDATIRIDFKPGKLAELPAGAFLNLGVYADQQTAWNIDAQGPCLGGCGGSEVKAVDAERNTITYHDKAMAEVAGKTFTVAKDLEIVIDGKRAKLADLPVGAFVNVTLSVDRQTALQVTAQGPQLGDCGGSLVTAVDPVGNTLTFDSKAGADVAGKTFTVATEAWIMIDGQRGKLAELPAGSYVNVRLSVDRRMVVGVTAQGPPVPCDCGGSLVKAVDTEKRTITIADSARAEVAGKTFTVAADANIFIDGNKGTLSDLPPGSYVDLRLGVDQKSARHVNAQGPTAPLGILKAVDVEKSTVTVGNKTYPVVKGVKILISGKPGRLAELPTEANVSFLRMCVDQKTVSAIFVD
jgi:RNA polymerase sigma factor (sigma-70 family)